MSCDWDPEKNQMATSEDKIHATATVVVGAKIGWHLCDECSALPQFKKYRYRHRLKKCNMIVITEDEPCSTTE